MKIHIVQIVSRILAKTFLSYVGLVVTGILWTQFQMYCNVMFCGRVIYTVIFLYCCCKFMVLFVTIVGVDYCISRGVVRHNLMYGYKRADFHTIACNISLSSKNRFKIWTSFYKFLKKQFCIGLNVKTQTV